jgi:hypothetical protein
MWPTTKISPESWKSGTFDGTILGRYYDNSGFHFKLWVKPVEKKYKALLELFPEIPKDVLEKLSRSKESEVKRLIYSWRALEDCLLVSSPELVGKPITALHRKLWKWCFTTCIHSYEEFFKQWKGVVQHLRHFAGATDKQSENRFPVGVPGGRNGLISDLWYDNLPWLRELPIIQWGHSPTKDFLQRLGTLCQTRNFPPPPLNQKRFDYEVRDWKTDLTRQPNWNPNMAWRTERAMNVIVNFLKGKVLTPRPHISLSASACYSKSRAQGGRLFDFLGGWIEDFVRTPNSLEVRDVTLFGAPYVLEPGKPKCYTMCRSVPLDTEQENFLSSAFRDEMGTNTAMAVMFGGENSHIALEEPIFGLDPELPLQLLEYAVEQMFEAGYLTGRCYGFDFSRTISHKRIRARAHPVVEPGNKVRWITMEQSFVTVFLQPLAHWYAGILSAYPSLYSAFNRSYKGWDVAVALERQTQRLENGGFGVFDLKGASNNLNKHMLREIGERIIREFSPDDQSRSFLLLSLGILLQDREIEVFLDEKDMDIHRVIICTNGILMGNPGTKELLCLVSAVIHIMTCQDLGYSQFPYSLIAGDDVFIYSTKRFFDLNIKNHVEFGNTVQTSKVFFSKICVFFTEEVLQYIEEAIGINRSPWENHEDLPEYRGGIHVDTIKLRLLSPFGLQSLMGDESYTNPAIGKANALHNVFRWFPNKSMQLVASTRFNQWMSSYIGGHPSVFLPKWMGGYGFPWLGTQEELATLLMRECNPAIFRIVALKLNVEEDYHPVIDFLTRRMATGNTVRGLLDPLPYLISSQYAYLAISAWGDLCRNYKDFFEELQSKKSYNVRSRDVIRYLHSQGYMGYHDIVDSLDRLTAIRIAMVASIGLLSVEDVIPSYDRRLPNPNEVLENFVQNELGYFNEASFNRHELEPSIDDISRFRDWVHAGIYDQPVNTHQVFIPKRALTDSLNGMTIPMPYTPNENPIKGSLADDDRALIIGYIAKMVDIRRTKRF